MRIMSLRALGAAALLLTLAMLAAGCGGRETCYQDACVGGHQFPLAQQRHRRVHHRGGYGYPVEVVVQTTPVLKETLPEGEVDLNLEGWQQNIPEWYEEHTAKGNIVNLGMTFEGGPQFFMIPKSVAEQYNIRTIEDMKDHWELFKDPDDPTKGVFYNCLIGEQCTKINDVKLEAYGLTRYYNLVSPGSNDAKEAVLERAQKKGQPVFGYYWAPNPLMGVYDWQILEEPPYSSECWGAVTAASEDASLRPIDRACAYETLPIDKLAHSSLQQKAPDVVEMLKKMNIGLDPLTKTLAWAEEFQVEDWGQVAVYYLQTFGDRWPAWVTPKAQEQIERALSESSLPQQ